MAQYYYTAASLPMLKADTKPEITEQHFLEAIEQGLSDKHIQQVMADLKSLVDQDNLGEMSRSGREFWRREKNLRNELVKMRAAAKIVDAKSFIQNEEMDPFVVDSAMEAFKAESPLEAELVLDHIRWKWLDELESGHQFDVDYFTVYYLKLKILLRKEKFEIEQGKENFQTVYKQVLDAHKEETGVSR